MHVVESLQQEDLLIELQENMETILNVNKEFREHLMSDLYDSSSTYISEQTDEFNEKFDQLISKAPSDALKKAHNEISSEIGKCIEKADEVVKVIDLKFAIFELEVEKILAVIKESLNSPLDESKKNEVIDEYKIHQPSIDGMGSEMLRDSELGLSNVKQCVDSITNVFPLFARSVTDDLKTNLQNLWSGFKSERDRLSTKIQEESLSHIREGLARMEEVSADEEIKQRIYDCEIESNHVVEAANVKFNEIIQELQLQINDFTKRFRLEGLTGDTYADLLDRYEEEMYDFNEILDSKATSAKELLSQLESDSILVPLTVKECVDDIVKLSEFSTGDKWEL